MSQSVFERGGAGGLLGRTREPEDHFVHVRRGAGLMRTLANVNGEVNLEVEGQATQRSVLDALEARYPMLRGTIRD